MIKLTDSISLELVGKLLTTDEYIELPSVCGPVLTAEKVDGSGKWIRLIIRDIKDNGLPQKRYSVQLRVYQ